MALELNGKKISDIRSQLGGLLGLGGGETAKVNGISLAEDVAVKDGDSVEFVKESGQKGSVDVSAGVNKVTLSLAGQMVSSVKTQLTSILNLGGDEVAKVNGVEISGDARICDGDKIEFVKKSGQKGAVTVRFDGKTVTGDYAGDTIESVINDLDGMNGFPDEYVAKINGKPAIEIANETDDENGDEQGTTDPDQIELNDGDVLIFDEVVETPAPVSIPVSGAVKVRCGVNSMDLSTLNGKTITDARAMVGSMLGVDADMTARVNGADAQCGQTLRNGDVVEFVKTAGQKG